MQRPFGHEQLEKKPKIQTNFIVVRALACSAMQAEACTTNKNSFRRPDLSLLNRADHAHDFYHRLNIVDTHNARAVSNRPRDGGGGAKEPLVGLWLAGDGPDETFAAGADNERAAQGGELFHLADEGEIVVEIFSKAD